VSSVVSGFRTANTSVLYRKNSRNAGRGIQTYQGGLGFMVLGSTFYIFRKKAHIAHIVFYASGGRTHISSLHFPGNTLYVWGDLSVVHRGFILLGRMCCLELIKLNERVQIILLPTCLEVELPVTICFNSKTYVAKNFRWILGDRCVLMFFLSENTKKKKKKAFRLV
jgi:hypothetical protein